MKRHHPGPTLTLAFLMALISLTGLRSIPLAQAREPLPPSASPRPSSKAGLAVSPGLEQAALTSLLLPWLEAPDLNPTETRRKAEVASLLAPKLLPGSALGLELARARLALARRSAQGVPGLTFLPHSGVAVVYAVVSTRCQDRLQEQTCAEAISRAWKRAEDQAAKLDALWRGPLSLGVSRGELSRQARELALSANAAEVILLLVPAHAPAPVLVQRWQVADEGEVLEMPDLTRSGQVATPGPQLQAGEAEKWSLELP